MTSKGVQSNFILRLWRKKDTWKIRLLDVRSGKTLEFSSLEALSRYLETLPAHSSLR